MKCMMCGGNASRGWVEVGFEGGKKGGVCKREKRILGGSGSERGRKKGFDLLQLLSRARKKKTKNAKYK